MEGPDLYKLFNGGQLMPFEYRKPLSNLMSTVISGVCSELGLPFGGGTNRSFERNGPAWNDGRVSQDGVLYSVLHGIPRSVLQSE